MSLAVIILNYCNAAGAVAAARSAANEVLPGAQTFIIDNNSPDDSWEQLTSSRYLQTAAVELIASPRNDGYSAGNNIGLRLASTQGFKWALILNPDAVLLPGAVAAMLAMGESHERVAVVGAVLLQAQDPTRLQSAGGAWYNRWLGRSSLICEGLLISEMPDTKLQELLAKRPPDYPSGACLLVRLEALVEVGFLNERFFLYYEELDLLQRLHAAGWETRAATRAHVLHAGGASTGAGRRGPMSPLAAEHSTRSCLIYTRTWAPAAVAAVLLSRLLRSAALWLTGRPQLAVAVLRGVRGGFRA